MDFIWDLGMIYANFFDRSSDLPLTFPSLFAPMSRSEVLCHFEVQVGVVAKTRNTNEIHVELALDNLFMTAGD